MVILTRALGRSRRHCWKYGHTMQWGRSWMSFQSSAGIEPGCCKRHATKRTREAPSLFHVKQRLPPVHPALSVGGRQIPPWGPMAASAGHPCSRLVIQCVRWALERTLEVLPMAIQTAVADGLRDEMSVVV